MTKAAFFKWTILISFIAIITMSLIWIHSLTEFMPTEISKKQADSFLINIKAQQFSATGHLIRQTTANKVEHYPKSNSSEFSNPNITLYTDNSQPWTIHAEHGKSTHNNSLIELTGKVLVHQNASNTQTATTLTTEQLFYNVKSKLIYNDKPVTILRDNSITHAVGIRFDLSNNALLLKSNMVTQISPSQPSNQ